MAMADKDEKLARARILRRQNPEWNMTLINKQLAKEGFSRLNPRSWNDIRADEAAAVEDLSGEEPGAPLEVVEGVPPRDELPDPRELPDEYLYHCTVEWLRRSNDMIRAVEETAKLVQKLGKFMDENPRRDQPDEEGEKPVHVEHQTQHHT